MKLTTLIIVVGSAALSGCVSIGHAVTVADEKNAKAICDILPAITYDGNVDSPETKAQIKTHNARRNAFCVNPK